MTAPNAFISIDQIVASYQLTRGYPIHYYYQLLKLAADATRELSLSYMPMVNHVVLRKETNETWFTLPDGYTDYVSVGLILGERWRPVAVTQSLMGMPNMTGGGDYNPATNNNEYNSVGEWTGWLNPEYAVAESGFNVNDFSGDSFNETDITLNSSPSTRTDTFGWAYPYGYALWNTEHFNEYWESKGRFFGGTSSIRSDSVQFVPEKNIIMCPYGFPSNELYLIYTGIGNVDSMTHIPVLAQNAIEAKMEWQYRAPKRNVGAGEKREYERLYYIQEKIMMRRFDSFNLTELGRILAKNFKRSKA